MPTHYALPIEKFKQQARQAKQRGIDWDLTFDQWMAAWLESGKWELRGKKAGQYVMARKGDVGPYSLDNIYFCLASENHRHAHENGRVPVRPKATKATRSRVVRGWTYIARSKSRPYQVMCGKSYVGSYATQAEAEAAYAAAVAAKHSLNSGGVNADPTRFDSLNSHGLKHGCASPATPLN